MIEIDYDQIIQEMREENERQAAEWQKEILKQFEPRELMSWMTT